MDTDTDPYDSDPIEPASADVQQDDSFVGFSDYGTSFGSSGFTSLASHVLRHRHEDGRRYQSFRQDGYPLPNDEIEQEREEMKHQMIKRLLDGSDFLAPIGLYPQKILDIGTGSGLWAIDVADAYPSAQVVGVDITPIQTPCIPHNALWRIDDVENIPWTHAYANTDFIHLRSTVQTLTKPLEVIDEAFRNLNPGGWIEFEDSSTQVACDDHTLPENYPPSLFFERLNNQYESAHQWNLNIHQRLPNILRERGFVNVTQRRHKIPIGAWAKDLKRRELGLYMSKHVLWQLARAVLVQWPRLGMKSKEEAESLEHDIQKSLDDTSIHAYLPWLSTCAQKPPI